MLVQLISYHMNVQCSLMPELYHRSEIENERERVMGISVQMCLCLCVIPSSLYFFILIQSIPCHFGIIFISNRVYASVSIVFLEPHNL